MLTFKDNVDQDILKQIETALLRPKSPITFDMKIEGQKINDNGQYVIGPWAGPEADISNLLHEASHFAEREIEKLLLFPNNSWGFSFGKYWEIGSQSGYEPTTNKSVLREQRVWAYQLAILRQYNLEDDPVELVKSVTWLGAWCYYQPFSENTHEDEPRIKQLAKEANVMSRNEYDYVAFIDAWNKRIERLRNVVNKNAKVCS